MARSATRALSLLGLGATAGLGGCFGGILTDGTSSDGLNGATIRVKGCPTCPVNTTTSGADDLNGAWKFDPYDGGPTIAASSGAEAVEIRASKFLYSTRVVYHKLNYRTNPLNEERLFDMRDFGLHSIGAADSDGDGLKDAEEIAIGTNPNNADTDGDALSDGWEVNGHNFVDLKALGANPRKKDVFVECDYMPGRAPTAAAITRVVTAFANAPVSNPDGSSGIALHVTIDDQVPNDPDLNPVWTEVDAIKSTNFSSFRDGIFHYCLFANNYSGGSSSGLSRGIQGEDFIVTLGSFANTEDQQAGTFMHELGHNLGLRHGGGDNTNRKPNYLSVMSYSFQMPGLQIGGVAGNMDYSRFVLANLAEGSLSESAGLNAVSGITEAALAAYATRFCRAGTPNTLEATAGSDIDWNGNGMVSGTVSADVNCDGSTGALTTQNDWANMAFDGGGTIGPGIGGDGKSPPRMTMIGDDEPCLTPADLR
jgi:hypothetical protein